MVDVVGTRTGGIGAFEPTRAPPHKGRVGISAAGELDRLVKRWDTVPRNTGMGPARRRCDVFEWSEEQEMVRVAVRQFIDKEIRPKVEEFEHGDTPPYDVLRKMFRE